MKSEKWYEQYIKLMKLGPEIKKYISEDEVKNNCDLDVGFFYYLIETHIDGIFDIPHMYLLNKLDISDIYEEELKVLWKQLSKEDIDNIFVNEYSAIEDKIVDIIIQDVPTITFNNVIDKLETIARNWFSKDMNTLDNVFYILDESIDNHLNNLIQN